MSDFRPMNPPIAAQECPGWFGKIPSLGDFATRRLPISFVAPWDEWLSVELSSARVFLADTWTETYGQAPVSCFALGAGVLDDLAHAWLGILVPSVDRVGRQYPLTIAMLRPPDAAATVGRRWWATLAATGRRALDSTGGADAVDEVLATCRGEADVEGMPPELAHLGEGMSAWWSGFDDTCASIVRGLPRAECFRQLLGAHY